MGMKLVATLGIILLFSSLVLAQPEQTIEFNYRGIALAGCDATIDGEGNILDIFDISNQENPAASHFNEGYGLPEERIDKIGGADKFSFGAAVKTLKYPGPPADNGDDRNWYWLDGVARILVEKGFNEFFSTRFQFRGGYNTMRMSYASEYRHNYTASTLDWANIVHRVNTSGAAAILPIGEVYFTYHSPFGLSVGAGGGYGFNEFEDMYYSGGWNVTTQGKVTGYQAKFGGRFVVPNYEDYGGVGLNYNIGGGTVANEEGNDYDMFVSNDSRLGLQAEFGYPGYVRGAVGYDIIGYEEDYLTSASDDSADVFNDDVSRMVFGLKVFGHEIGAPLTLGIRTESYNTVGVEDEGEYEPNLKSSNFGVGLSAEPVTGWTITTEYKTGKTIYEPLEEDEFEVDNSGFAVGMELFFIPEMGIRVGFETIDFEPDSAYRANYGGFDYYGGEGDMIVPYYSTMTVSRFGVVPVQTKGNALSWGLAFRLDDDRLQLDLSGRHILASEPQVYNDETGDRHEGYLGLTYYLK